MKTLLVIAAIACSFGNIFSEDPDDDLTTCQLVSNKGYPCQEFNVTTTDGYILRLHRIPHGRNSSDNATNSIKQIAFLQHGLVDSSATWVLNFPNQSLGFLMADAGYDVWMGNVRGNIYSRASTKYNAESDDFWNFTFDEMAKYDIPAMIDYVLNSTGQQYVYYVGHSQGTLVGFIEFSQNPTWAKAKIKQFHALAPVAYMGHITSPLRWISPFANYIGILLDMFGYDEFLPTSKMVNWLAGSICNPPFEFICSNFLWVMSGYDFANMNQTRNSVYITHCPAGTSTYNMVHFAQLMHSNKFQMMDWGYFDNVKYYGSHYAPLYNASAMTVPTALYFGDNDQFSDPVDVQYLQSLLQNVMLSYESANMDHTDFVWGLNAAVEIYPTILRLISEDVAISSNKTL